jgi:sialic acid synthase SpsE
MVKTRRFPPAAPYLVAAVDDNHGGNPALARRLVVLAADCGAHAVKFSFRPSATRPLSAAREAAKGRLAFVAAPYDLESFARARRLEPDVYQIDPPVLGDRELLRAVRARRKPVLLVAGMCTDVMIAAALRELRSSPVVLMHAVSEFGIESFR